MEEKEILKILSQLRKIKPEKNFVFSKKREILGEDFKPFPFFKLGLLSIFFLLILASFSFKHLTQKSLISQNEKNPEISLNLAQKKAEKLEKIAKENQTKKLAPALKEFQESLSKANQNLKKIEARSSNLKEIKNFVDRAKAIEKKAKEIKSLGIVLEEKELEKLNENSKKLELESLALILQNLISDLKTRNLSQKQKAILDQMIELVNQKEYSKALEIYLENQ